MLNSAHLFFRSSEVVVRSSTCDFSCKWSFVDLGGHLGWLWCGHSGLPSGLPPRPSFDRQVSSLLDWRRRNGGHLWRKQLSQVSFQGRTTRQRQEKMAEDTFQEIWEEEAVQEVTAKFKSQQYIVASPAHNVFLKFPHFYFECMSPISAAPNKYCFDVCGCVCGATFECCWMFPSCIMMKSP